MTAALCLLAGVAYAEPEGKEVKPNKHFMSLDPVRGKKSKFMALEDESNSAKRYFPLNRMISVTTQHSDGTSDVRVVRLKRPKPPAPLQASEPEVTSESIYSPRTRSAPLTGDKTGDVLALFDDKGRTAHATDISTRIQYMWPVPPHGKGKFTSDFGERVDPISGEDGAFHKGVDIAAPRGTSAIAAADGAVDLIGSHRHLGNYVRLLHADGVTTIYGHLNSISVREGQKLKQGEEVGKVGSTGRSTGPHLHFTVLVDGESMDPLSIVKKSYRPYISPRKQEPKRVKVVEVSGHQ